MALILTEAHINQMTTHAEQAYPYEGCGLMVGTFDATTNDKKLVTLVLLENAWAPDIAEDFATDGDGDSAHMTKARRYWIDPKDLLMTQRQARKDGQVIIGVYHSHPDAHAKPSECDRELAWPSYSYSIVSVQKGIASDLQNWQLDANQQFQPEPMNVTPASAARDRMPLLSS